jgi:predicted lysophospholipase L1 biosynthesis ABC-type transport system permease subunit
MVDALRLSTLHECEQKMNLLCLSLSLLRRDWRAGEWRVLLIALVLAVGSIATVGLFADRVRLALQFRRVDKRSASTNLFMKKEAA